MQNDKAIAILGDLGGMMHNYRLVRLPAIAITGLFTAWILVGLSAYAQTSEDNNQNISTLVESTTISDESETIASSTATTVDDLTIPIDQLELLIKPLAVEQLQALQVRTQELGIELAAPVQEIKVSNSSSFFKPTTQPQPHDHYLQ